MQGCDASILLDSTPPGEPVEKISPANEKTIKGLDVIDQIKAQLEQECPQTVYCADILKYATREVVFLSGLPYYHVQGGRRDGLTSHASDMIVLAGAHSIGNVHCKMFDYRPYRNLTDTKVPPVEPWFAAYLKTKCLPPSLGTTEERDDAIVKFDPAAPFTVDSFFLYKSVETERIARIGSGIGFWSADKADCMWNGFLSWSMYLEVCSSHD